MKSTRFSVGSALALACALTAPQVQATEAIMFDPDGPGPLSPISVLSFDWMPNSALAVNGNPSGGLATGSVVHLLAHARLGTMLKSDDSLALAAPGTEITFVAGFAEMATVNPATGAATFAFDATAQLPNFFEMWISSPADGIPIQGTGYNNTKRILYGAVTGAFGNYGGGLPLVTLDQFGVNNYPAISTITGGGSTQLVGVIISADPDYFPGLTPAQVADLKVFFNTSTVTPYKQVDPSANFVGDSAGADGSSPPPANVPMNTGPVNGGLQTVANLNFVLQADSNQGFEKGVDIPGACRVTYGGNDRNGNIDLTKFGQICGKVKGKEQCYTFGGQVGAPTTDPAQGGPFGEHTHHQFLGEGGDFVFRAGTRSAPKSTRITAVACKDPGAIRQAEANAGFKQIDFEGTGSFRTMNAVAKNYLKANGGPSDIDTDNVSDKKYYFRVDMVDAGEPGNKGKKLEASKCAAFLNADQNNPLATPDPLLLDYVSGGGSCADLYQFFICPSEAPCEQAQAMYAIRGFLTGGNIQLHKVVK